MKIAIISDIHEDYVSLKKAERMISGEGCEEVICLGDIVGFSVPFYTYHESRDANACIRWVQDHCKWAVAGNHDLYAIRKLPVSSVRGFVYPPHWYSLPFSDRVRISENRLWLYEDNELSALLDADTAEYLNQLPEMVIIDVDGTRCLLSHYIYPDLTGSAMAFLAGYDDLRDHIQYMQRNLCSLGFSGHIHPGGYFRMPQPTPEVIRFGKTGELLPFDWVGVPPITCSKNNNGFLVWDTKQHTIKAIPLRKKFLLG
jgi:predicted phosphodiesterase